MSDLCYNCGDCHLPQPCTMVLKLCDLCKNHGHTYNFCPMGVRNKDPFYQFWALCQNCDQWHLPQPCIHDLHKCTQCGQKAHLEYFCPVRPIDRKAILAAQNVKTGSKRQRTDGLEGEDEAGETTMDPLVVRRIRVDATLEVVELLKLGYNYDLIIQHMSRPAAQLNGRTPGKVVVGVANVNSDGATNHGEVSQLLSDETATKTPQASAMQHDPTVTTPLAAPTPTGSAKQGEPGERVYNLMHERFSRGDLLENQGQGSASQTAADVGNFQANPNFSNVTPGTHVTLPDSNNHDFGFGEDPSSGAWNPGSVHGTAASTSATAVSPGHLLSNDGASYNKKVSDFMSADVLQQVLANLGKYNKQDQAPADPAPNTGLPPLVTNNDNSFPANTFEFTPVPSQQAQPQMIRSADADSYTVPATAENLEPELTKKGQPKKKAAPRKRKN